MPMTCPHCGASFERHHHHLQKYCTTQCQKQHSDRRKRIPNPALDRERRRRYKASADGKAKRREWARNSPTERERVRKTVARWRAEQPERAQESTRRYDESPKRAEQRDRYRERAAANRRRWERDNPDSWRERKARRRARKLNAGGSHTKVEFRERCREFGWRCAYCLKPVGPESVHADHVIALARCGSDSIDNIVPACGDCNYAKGAKTLVAFIAAARRAS